MPTGEYVMKSFHINKTDLKAAAINLVRNLPITIEYMAAATLISTIFFHFSNNVTNISIIYTLAIIMIARATSCYGAGILASLFGVFWVNFAFTYPYLTLNFTMSGYPITFLGMALISSLSSSICIMITKQNVQLQEKDRMLLNAEKETIRANLMRAMSHDLRTPLTSIIGSSSTYLSQEEYMSPGEKRKLVRNIEEDAQWLLNMVENLLSVTRIQDEKGIASVVKADESLEEVISDSVRRFRKRFPDVQVRVSIPDSVIIIPMDATLIEQVINNLLENALFHSGTNEPIELVAATEKADSPSPLKISARGLPPICWIRFLTAEARRKTTQETDTKEWESVLASAKPSSMPTEAKSTPVITRGRPVYIYLTRLEGILKHEYQSQHHHHRRREEHLQLHRDRPVPPGLPGYQRLYRNRRAEAHRVP